MRRLHELYAGEFLTGEPDESGNGKPGEFQAGEPGESGAVGAREHEFLIPGFREHTDGKLHINILAMGDVGGTLALAMRLTGADLVSKIGICDISDKMLRRWEQELNQIALPSDPEVFPPVVPVQPSELFDCDVFVFCASRGVPDVSQTDVDVRMVQLEKNLELVRAYAKQAVGDGFEGEFFVVSDPVDPLCKGAVLAGLSPRQVQGFGLGVMNGRAAYYARQAAGQVDGQVADQADGSDPGGESIHRAMAAYLTEGRVFGPHGEDLVVANSIVYYDEEASLELTRLTTTANLRIRELGFKPYIAPAVTSGALSILENLRGNWQYSSAWFGAAGSSSGGAAGGGADAICSSGCGGAFLGMRNRRTKKGLLVEDLPLDDRLFERIERAYRNLERING